MKSWLTLKEKSAEFYKLISSSLAAGEILQSSIVIAYYILFSIFPIIIIVGNILPLFHIETKPIADYLRLVFPDQVSGYIIPIVNTLLKNKSNGYISFGIILAIWSFSSLVNAIRIGMNRIYGVHETELHLSMLNFIWTRTFTVLLTTLMIIVFTGVILVLAFGQQILEFLGPIFSLSRTKLSSLFSYKYPVIILILVVAVAYLNYVLPNIKIDKKVIWPGVFVTVIAWLGLSYLFGLYLHHFPISWKNYGVVGAFIIFMFWLNFSALILLFGTSINAAILKVKNGEIGYSAGKVASYIQKRRHSK